MSSMGLSKRYRRVQQVFNLSSAALAFTVVLFLSFSVSSPPVGLETVSSNLSEAFSDKSNPLPEFCFDDCGEAVQHSADIPVVDLVTLPLAVVTVCLLLFFLPVQARAPPKPIF